MTALLIRLFVKDHTNLHSRRVRRAYGTVVSIVNMLTNVLLFAVKFTVGTLSGSLSITADAVNNLSDAGSQVVSLISFRISAKPADREHPFGHARIEYVASMIVSFLVLHIGFDLLRDSVKKILHPDPPERSWIVVAVLGIAILTKLWLALFNRSIGHRIDSAVMKANAADCLSDCLSTAAVLLSVAIPLVFPSVTLNLDAYMGVAVAALILVAGVKIFNEAKNSILGEAPSDEIVAEIKSVVDSYEGALGIHDLVVHNYGPGRIVASLHIEVDGKEDIFRSHDMIDNLERRLRQECGIEATIHMDPIVTDDAIVNALRQQTASVVQAIDERLQIHDFRCVMGTTHTNLIFDVATPFELALSNSELRAQIQARIQTVDPTYFTVVTVDRQ